MISFVILCHCESEWWYEDAWGVETPFRSNIYYYYLLQFVEQEEKVCDIFIIQVICCASLPLYGPVDALAEDYTFHLKNCSPNVTPGEWTEVIQLWEYA